MYITSGLECTQITDKGIQKKGWVTDIFDDETFIVRSGDNSIEEYDFEDIGKKVFFDTIKQLH